MLTLIPKLKLVKLLKKEKVMTIDTTVDHEIWKLIRTPPLTYL